MPELRGYPGVWRSSPLRMGHFRYGSAIPPRDAPELCMKPSPKTEGVGNAGCPLHPQPCVQK